MLTVIFLFLLAFILLAGYEMTKDAPTTQDLPKTNAHRDLKTYDELTLKVNRARREEWERVKKYCNITDTMLSRAPGTCISIVEDHGFVLLNHPLKWVPSVNKFMLVNTPLFKEYPQEFITKNKQQ